MTTSAFSSVKVNVSLCGSVPRDEIQRLSLVSCAPLVLQSSSELNTLERNKNNNFAKTTQNSTQHTIENNGDAVVAAE